MPDRGRVVSLLEAGMSYDDVARRLGITPGLAYLIATGLPADGSDAPTASARERPGFLESSQHLSNPRPADNPTTSGTVEQWLRRRVAADAPMRAAAAARDASPGERRTDPDRDDVADVLTRDHNQVNALLKQLSTIPGKRQGGAPDQMSSRKTIVDLVTVALTEHEAAEEQHLWPAVRRLLPDGDERADRALAQEQDGKSVLTALSRLEGDQDEFDEHVERLTAVTRRHVAFEEQVFLDLRAHVDTDRLRALGSAVAKARGGASTVPHPGRTEHETEHETEQQDGEA